MGLAPSFSFCLPGVPVGPQGFAVGRKFPITRGYFSALKYQGPDGPRPPLPVTELGGPPTLDAGILHTESLQLVPASVKLLPVALCHRGQVTYLTSVCLFPRQYVPNGHLIRDVDAVTEPVPAGLRAKKV